MIRTIQSFSIRSLRYASALKLSPITPSKLPSSSIRFYPSVFRYSSVKLPCYILPLSVLFRFAFGYCRQFCRFLEQMKTDYANPESLVVRCVLFSYSLCLAINKTEPLGKAGRETNITCTLGLPHLWFFMPAVACFDVAHSQKIAMFIAVADKNTIVGQLMRSNVSRAHFSTQKSASMTIYVRGICIIVIVFYVYISSKFCTVFYYIIVYCIAYCIVWRNQLVSSWS